MLSGADQIAELARRRPPISILVGLHVDAIDEDEVAFRQEAGTWLQDAYGTVPLGALAMLADAPLGWAVQRTLPALTPYRTLQMSLRLLAAEPGRGDVVARGRLVRSDGQLAASRAGMIVGGQLVAEADSLCFSDEPLASLPPGDGQLWIDGGADGDDPLARAVRGEPLPAAARSTLDGLERLRGRVAERLPLPPLHHLTGLAPVAADPGTATFALPATGWLCPVPGRVEGGAIAMLAGAAISGAIETTLPAAGEAVLRELSVYFCRPAAADGRRLTGEATVEHRGRRTAVGRAQLHDESGRLIAVGTGVATVRATEEGV